MLFHWGLHIECDGSICWGSVQQPTAEEKSKGLPCLSSGAAEIEPHSFWRLPKAFQCPGKHRHGTDLQLALPLNFLKKNNFWELSGILVTKLRTSSYITKLQDWVYWQIYKRGGEQTTSQYAVNIFARKASINGKWNYKWNGIYFRLYFELSIKTLLRYILAQMSVILQRSHEIPNDSYLQ